MIERERERDLSAANTADKRGEAVGRGGAGGEREKEGEERRAQRD